MNVRPVSMQATPIKRSNGINTNNQHPNFGSGSNLMKSWYKGIGVTTIVSIIAGTITGICTTAQKHQSAIKHQATNIVQKAENTAYKAYNPKYIKAALPKTPVRPIIGAPKPKPKTPIDNVKKMFGA